MIKEANQGKPRGFLWNTSVYLTSTFFSFALSIVFLPVYTRYLSPADYGVVALFAMFGSLVVGVISSNIHFSSYMYYFQFKKDPERFKSVFSTNALFVLGVFFVFGIIVWYSSGVTSAFVFRGRISSDLLFLSYVSGCLEYLGLYMTIIITAQVRSVQYATTSIIKAVLATVFSFYFILLHSMTYSALIYSQLISQSIVLLILLVLVRHLIALRFSWPDLKMSVKLAFPLVPNSLIGLVNSSFDKTMLSNLKNTESVGYYSFGQRFSLILKTLQDAVSKSWDPYFMAHAHQNTAEAKQAIIKRYYEIAFLFMSIGLVMIYYSEETIRLLTTEAFYPSMYVMPLYVYYYLFAIIGMLAMNQVQFSKKMAFLLPVSASGVVINIILNLILIPNFGAVGATAALAVSALSNSAMLLYFGMRLYPLPLGKTKFALMYLLLFVFTIPVYPIMLTNISFFLKIAVKSVLLISFVLAGIKMQYISRSSIQRVFGKITGAVMNLTGT